MAQITTGLRAVLSSPRIYDLAQSIIGATHFRRGLARDYLQLGQGMSLLDIGCGTARILPHLSDGIRYVGVDLSSDYIDAARAEFGSRGEFHCIDVGKAVGEAFRNFDCVLATGLLHHLDDDEALAMLRTAHGALASDGRLITVDPCVLAGQSRIAAFLVSKDRGQNVRTPGGYLSLAQQVFPRATVHARDDLLHIPYNHAVLECSR